MTVQKFVAAVVVVLAASVHSNPAGWETCGGMAPSYNATACPTANGTCCVQHWMPSSGNWGCCPYPDAVCCVGGYTCCPQGSTCVNVNWGTFHETTTCVAANGDKKGPGEDDGGGQEVCKTGGPMPFSTTKKNVIILGDSVSIGYEPIVATMMADVALVQHSPWGGDGGAEETHYGWECLDYLMAAPDGTPQRPDVLWFNFGLHNLNNVTLPGQSGPIAEYGPYLERIVTKLQAMVAGTKTKILFGITTPFMCLKSTDDIVVTNNQVAAGIMAKYNIPTVDMHTAITNQCGPAPNASCFGQHDCFCPHCPMDNAIGYNFIAKTTIVPAIQKLLNGLD